MNTTSVLLSIALILHTNHAILCFMATYTKKCLTILFVGFWEGFLHTCSFFLYMIYTKIKKLRGKPFFRAILTITSSYASTYANVIKKHCMQGGKYRDMSAIYGYFSIFGKSMRYATMPKKRPFLLLMRGFEPQTKRFEVQPTYHPGKFTLVI